MVTPSIKTEADIQKWDISSYKIINTNDVQESAYIGAELARNNKIKVIHKTNQVFSRIHVADIANAIIYLLQNQNKLEFHQIIFLYQMFVLLFPT